MCDNPRSRTVGVPNPNCRSLLVRHPICSKSCPVGSFEDAATSSSAHYDNSLAICPNCRRFAILWHPQSGTLAPLTYSSWAPSPFWHSLVAFSSFIHQRLCTAATTPSSAADSASTPFSNTTTNHTQHAPTLTAVVHPPPPPRQRI